MLNRVLADEMYKNTAYTNFSYTTISNFVLNRIGMHGNSAMLGDYYDAMDTITSSNILGRSTTPLQRAQICYTADPVAVFDAMKGQAWFPPMMESALQATTSVSFMNFAFSLEQNIDIGVSLEAFLIPKIRKDHYYLAEHHLYGSSRLGIKRYWPNHYAFSYDYTANNQLTWGQSLDVNQLLSIKRPWYSHALQGLVQANETSPYGHANTNQVLSTRQLGQKQYELTNHLGNVMAVVSDKLVDTVATANTTTDTLPAATLRKAWTSASYDYYPYGMLMPERYTEDKTIQCTPVTTSVYYPHWVDVSIIAMDDMIDKTRFTTVFTMDVMDINTDAKQLYLRASPTGEEQAVSTELNTGVQAGKEMNVSFRLNNNADNYVSVEVQQQNALSEWETLASTTVAREADVSLSFTPSYASMLKLSIKGHDIDAAVGSVRYKRVDIFNASVVSQICNNDAIDDDYRFGFNGQMKDNEVKGTGNSLSFMYRIYDSRLGKFLSVDPLTKTYPWYTPYQFAGNTPIQAIDIEGAEELKVADKTLSKAFYGMAQLVVAQDKELQSLLSSVSRPDMAAKQLVYLTTGYTVGIGEHGNTTGRNRNIKIDAQFLATYQTLIKSKEYRALPMLEKADLMSKREHLETEFQNWGIDYNEVANAKQSEVYVVLVEDNYIENNGFSVAMKTLVHEIKAHLENMLNGVKKSSQKEHSEYFDIPMDNKDIQNNYSPKHSDVKPNSIGGKLNKAVDRGIDKLKSKK